MSIFHNIFNGIHQFFVKTEHAVEKVKFEIDARPGLKADLEKLGGPIKDAVLAAFTAKYSELTAASPADAPKLFKAAVPDLLKTVETAQGFLKSIVAWLYSKVFSTEIAAQEKEKQDLLADLASFKAEALARVKADQDQIDAAERQKAGIISQIKTEEKIQQADEAKITEVHVEEQKAVDAINSRSDDELLRGNF